MAKERSDAERAERKAKKLKVKAEAAEQTATSPHDAEKRDKKRKKQDVEHQDSKAKRHRRESDASDVETVITSNGDKAMVIPLVPFAQPMADDKQKHKLLKAVRRGVKHKTLKRGVKEITKAARKTPSASGSSVSAAPSSAPAVAIIAADVWPEDVVSHIPVHCEDKNIPFIFVDSRKDLGEAGATKRPTSCLLLMRDNPASKGQADAKSEDDGKETWDDTFKSVLKMVNKERQQYSW